MTKHFSELQRIDNNQSITDQIHGAFLCHLERARLQALLERGMLNITQYRHAEEALQKQHFGQGEPPWSK